MGQGGQSARGADGGYRLLGPEALAGNVGGMPRASSVFIAASTDGA